MLIHSPTEFLKPFVYTSTGYAVQELAKMLDAELVQFEQSEWGNVTFDKDLSNVDLVIFEAAYVEMWKIGTRQIRNTYPNAKLVCISSDDIYFILTGKNGGYQFPGVADCDLFLCQMTQSIDEYKQRGVNVDRWMWTGSKEFFQYCENLYDKAGHGFEKHYDFIGVYGPWTLEQGYRKEMVDAIKAAGMTFTQGGGSGHDDNNLDGVLESYCRSYFTLGTSSHNNPLLNDKWCVKGWRDFIGPFMGSLLIYDNNPDIINYYCQQTPIYEFGNFDSLIKVANFLKDCPEKRDFIIEAQKKWALENTIEKQLFRLLKEHKIV